MHFNSFSKYFMGKRFDELQHTQLELYINLKNTAAIPN